MTTPSTGDARAEERVVEVVARALEEKNNEGVDWSDPSHAPDYLAYEDLARAAIEAYRKAMRE